VRPKQRIVERSADAGDDLRRLRRRRGFAAGIEPHQRRGVGHGRRIGNDGDDAPRENLAGSIDQ
jgi:hypothetical protein